MQEVKEVILMPRFDAENYGHQGYDPRLVEIDDFVVHELGEYVKSIACMYRQNSFHNFKHACRKYHVSPEGNFFYPEACSAVLTLSFISEDVTMSVRKLFNRILLAQGMEKDLKDDAGRMKTEAMLHLYNYTHGLSSDPLAMFAMTFSALIHDAYVSFPV